MQKATNQAYTSLSLLGFSTLKRICTVYGYMLACRDLPRFRPLYPRYAQPARVLPWQTNNIFIIA